MPAVDYDIGNVNVSINPSQTDAPVGETPQDLPVVGWHTDSFPFVIVTMLSDCTNMVGGESMIKTGSGELKKIRGPTMV